MATKTVTDASFRQDVLEADRPVLVDFWSDTCPPCKMIAPVLEELSEEMEDRLTIAKVDIGEHLETATRYGIRAVPTLILFKNGVPAATKLGGDYKGNIQAWLERAL